jgi:aminopeptidase
MNKQDFEVMLEKYADLVIKGGLNLQKGQGLVIIAGPFEVAPLVRKIIKSAYQHGCRFVSVLWEDHPGDLVRYQNAPPDSFQEYDSWKHQGVLKCIERGDAFLQVAGRDPDLLKEVSFEILSTANRAYNESITPIRVHQTKDTVQWTVICPPTQGWASRVYPKDTPDSAEQKLWQDIIKVCRLDETDPTAYWKEYLANINQRAAYLTEKAYRSLRFTGPGTDLEVGLPEGHIWLGGGGKTEAGLPFTANLPTEEVFTMPHREQVNGVVTATKPLSYRGMLMDKFWIKFSDGKVVDFSAEVGEGKLAGLLDTDDNSRYLGEVALVPHQTPISQSGVVFLNTLYDENASNHLALGSAYRNSIQGGLDMSPDEFTKAGGNESNIHLDFMFGSGEMNVEGVLPDGSSEPVMEKGEWVIEI